MATKNRAKKDLILDLDLILIRQQETRLQMDANVALSTLDVQHRQLFDKKFAISTLKGDVIVFVAHAAPKWPKTKFNHQLIQRGFIGTLNKGIHITLS